MVFKSLQGSGEPCSTGGSSGLCFDNTVDLKGSEGTAPTVASQVSGNILGSEKKAPQLWSVRCRRAKLHQRLPLISVEILSSSECLYSSAACRLHSSVISGKKMHQVCICFLPTNAVLLFLKFCSYEIFSHVHIIPLPWAPFFFFFKKRSLIWLDLKGCVWQSVVQNTCLEVKEKNAA